MMERNVMNIITVHPTLYNSYKIIIIYWLGIFNFILISNKWYTVIITLLHPSIPQTIKMIYEMNAFRRKELISEWMN